MPRKIGEASPKQVESPVVLIEQEGLGFSVSQMDLDWK
jgi:hypothetical protein